MIYEYKCSDCGHSFESIQTVANRDKPTFEPCPHCRSQDTVTRNEVSQITMNYTGIKTPYQRLPESFKSRLRQIKRNAGQTATINV